MNAERPIPVLDGDALRAVRHRGSHMQIIACAGSGKTEVVAQRVADLLADGADARSIIAFTFTLNVYSELHMATFHLFLAARSCSNVDRTTFRIQLHTKRERGAVADQLSSPLATGDAGGTYEYDIAAIMLSRLLRGAEVPIGLHAPVVRVALQQSNQGYPLDDIVVWGHADPPAEEPCIQVQVKRTVKATAANAEFIKVMTQAVSACDGQLETIRERRVLFGLVARPSRSDHLDELIDLTELARAHEDSGSFQSQFREGITEKALRSRLTEVTQAVATAAGVPVQAASPLTHQILMALHIWQAEEGPDGQAWRTELDGLTDLAEEAGTTPMAFMNQLRSLAQRFGPRAGNVTAEHVRTALTRYGIYLSPASTGVKRPATNNTTINATGNSTVFNNTGGVQHFGPININSRLSARDEENGAS